MHLGTGANSSLVLSAAISTCRGLLLSVHVEANRVGPTLTPNCHRLRRFNSGLLGQHEEVRENLLSSRLDLHLAPSYLRSGAGRSGWSRVVSPEARALHPGIFPGIGMISHS